ncbi:hypothetical protein ACFSKU_07160 [Pontibacter silvestris]|uniref:PAP2 superfamily protein n=1 Tax=Pontibacter silvestris TaxID=2305183 RepID=A0ABW4WW71_9BACT|nr:hypothetical protein [Pontibacter silvestris]MCC9136569.1 hypothetical protein [Pontibacter silvestris]
MNRSIAQLLSVLFHPLLIPTYLFAFIMYYLPVSALTLPLRSRWIVLGMIFFTTFIIPGMGAYVMVRAGQLDSVEMDRREQRSLPLLFTTVCYAVTSYLLYREPAFDAIFYFVMAVIAVAVFLTYLISLFWKISAHGVGIGGGLGFLLILNRLVPEASLAMPIAVAIVLAGAVLSARLALHAHTPDQVYAGFSCGVALAFSAGMFL